MRAPTDRMFSKLLFFILPILLPVEAAVGGMVKVEQTAEQLAEDHIPVPPPGKLRPDESVRTRIGGLFFLNSGRLLVPRAKSVTKLGHSVEITTKYKRYIIFPILEKNNRIVVRINSSGRMHGKEGWHNETEKFATIGCLFCIGKFDLIDIRGVWGSDMFVLESGALIGEEMSLEKARRIFESTGAPVGE